MSLNELLLIIAFVAFFTVTAAPIIRYFETGIPLIEALRIAGWATMIAFGLYLVVVLALAFARQWGGVAINSLWLGRLVSVAVFGAGWLISYRLGQAGRKQTFPGTGARVVLGWIVLVSSFVIVGRFVLGWL
jgi:hypothetical protein